MSIGKIIVNELKQKQQPTKTTRRRTISDNQITSEMYDKILLKLYERFEAEQIEITQQNIIEMLLPLKLSNNMIAKYIREIIIDSKATAGSVAIQIRQIEKKKHQQDELLQMIEKGF